MKDHYWCTACEQWIRNEFPCEHLRESRED